MNFNSVDNPNVDENKDISNDYAQSNQGLI